MPPFSHQQSQTALSQRHSLNLRNYLPSTPNLHARSLSTPLLHPTKILRSTPPIVRTLASALHRRQVDPSIVPSTYSGINSGPAPGIVVGIVLGSVAGFLLLLWLIYTCFNLAGPSSAVYEEEVVRRRSHSPRRVSRSRSRSEVIEVARQRSPPRQRSPVREVRRETVIVEETRRPEREREDDIVEVFEEHSPPPPRRSRGSGSGGGRYYRTVDPEAFGGGNSAPRKFRR